MNQISESIFKVTSIFLAVHGLESFIVFFAKMQSIIPNERFEIPFFLYYAQALPILFGVLLWLMTPYIVKKSSGGSDNISTKSAVSIGCFLLGLYFVGNYLPEVISLFVNFKRFSKIGTIGDAFKSEPYFQILVARVLIGFILVFFSIKIGKIYIAIRRFGA